MLLAAAGGMMWVKYLIVVQERLVRLIHLASLQLACGEHQPHISK